MDHPKMGTDSTPPTELEQVEDISEEPGAVAGDSGSEDGSCIKMIHPQESF
jgi:hypothetical protein